MRIQIAMLCGRMAGWLSRAFGYSGTSLPGAVARRIAPDILKRLSSRVDTFVFVTGTNGKTTTSNLLAHLLRSSGYRVISNPEGSNMLSGIFSSFVNHMGLFSQTTYDVAVLEVDEASLPLVAKEITPQMAVVTNFFRDQLDRYGEIDMIVRQVDKALSATPAKLVLNADDPFASGLSSDGERVYFGIGEEAYRFDYERVSESVYCQECGQLLSYDSVHFGQLGHYRCECGYRRPDAVYELSGLQPNPLMIRLQGDDTEFRSQLAGTYNAYNILAAIAAAKELGVDSGAIAKALLGYRNVEGRMQKFQYRGVSHVLNLTKNPAGANAVIGELVTNSEAKQFLFILNDHTADGQDVSWIWDVDFERLRDARLQSVICAGTRAKELEVRLRYADLGDTRLVTISDPKLAVEEALRSELPTYIVPTYTALAPVRQLIKRKAKATR